MILLAAIFVFVALAITVYIHGTRAKQRQEEVVHHLGKRRIGL